MFDGWCTNDRLAAVRRGAVTFRSLRSLTPARLCARRRTRTGRRRPARSPAGRSRGSRRSDMVGNRRRVQAEPARRRDQAAPPQLDRIAAPVDQLAPDVRQQPPRPLAAGGDRTVGGHRTPGDPSAGVEEPAEVAGDLDEAGVQRASTAPPVRRRAAMRRRRRRSSARRPSPPARGSPSPSRAGRSPGRGRSGTRGSSARPSTARRATRSAATTGAPGHRVGDHLEVGAHRLAATSKARSAGAPTRLSAAPSVTGPVNCHFTGPRNWRAAAAARNARNPA